MRVGTYIAVFLLASAFTPARVQAGEQPAPVSDPSRFAVGGEPHAPAFSSARMQAMIAEAASDGMISDIERGRIFEYAARSLPASEVTKVTAQIAKLRQPRITKKANASDLKPTAPSPQRYQTVVVSVPMEGEPDARQRAVASDQWRPVPSDQHRIIPPAPITKPIPRMTVQRAAPGIATVEGGRDPSDGAISTDQWRSVATEQLPIIPPAPITKPMPLTTTQPARTGIVAVDRERDVHDRAAVSDRRGTVASDPYGVIAPAPMTSPMPPVTAPQATSRIMSVEHEGQSSTEAPSESVRGGEVVARRTCGHGASACSACGACQRCCQCKQHEKRVVGFADYLLLRPTGTDLPFAAPTEGCGSPHLGPASVLSSEFESALRFGAGILDPSKGRQLTGTYTYFRSHTAETATAPAGLVLDPLLRHPDTVVCGPADEASGALAAVDIDMDVIDIDYAQVCAKGDSYHLAWLVGGRWARIDQETNVQYNALETSFISVPIDMRGAGPRAGLLGNFDVGRGLHLYGRGIFSLLSTRQEAKFTQTNVFAGLETEFGQETDRIVPVIDLEFGVGYTCLNNHLTLRAGYLYSIWFNMITAPGYIEQVHSNDFDASSDTLAFDGISIRLQLTF